MSDLWKQIPANSLAVLDSYMTDHYLPNIGTDQGIVMIKGDQEIEDKKTFTEELKSKGNLVREHSDITKGTNPSSKQYWSVQFTDKNGSGSSNRLGLLETSLDTNGDVTTYISAYENVSESTTKTTMSVTRLADGTSYAEFPTPSVITENSNKGATTKWCFKGSSRNPTITKLFKPTTPLGAGNITLSKSYQNFDEIVIFAANDSQNYVTSFTIPTWELDKRFELARANKNKPVGLFYGNIYWAITAASTTTSWISSTENCCIYAIYGLNYRFPRFL